MSADQGGVTGTRYISRKISTSRNDEPATDPTVCHWCRESFASGQMRYPIFDGVNFGSGWELVSVCMDCFKDASDEYASPYPRYERDCYGCGEPMLPPIVRRFGRQVCSSRCYQRAYRKRRRNRWLWCPVCKKNCFESSRKDARFCSSRCRQWHYRQRKRSAA